MEQLVLVDYEVFVEHRNGNSRLACLYDELVASAEVFLVGEDANGSSSVLLIGEGNDVGFAGFLYPALGWRLPLELGYDAC